MMKIGISKLHVNFGCCPFYGGGSVVISLIVWVLCLAFVLLLCYTIHSVISSAAIILARKRELVVFAYSTVALKAR